MDKNPKITPNEAEKAFSLLIKTLPTLLAELVSILEISDLGIFWSLQFWDLLDFQPPSSLGNVVPLGAPSYPPDIYRAGCNAH